MRILKKICFIILIIFCSLLNIGMVVGTIYYSEKYKEFCTITFNSNGGTIIENKIVKSGSVIEFPEAPTKLGFNFIGWEYNGEIINEPIVIDKNTTFIAKWQANKTITYIVNFYNDDGTLITKQIVKLNDWVDVPSTPKKDGYTFEYWTYKGEMFDFNTKITENMDLHAVYHKIIEKKED